MENDEINNILKNTYKTIKGMVKGTLKIIPPIHSAGWPFIAGSAVAAALLGSFSEFLFWVFALLTLFCLYFFRDPVRTTPDREGLIVSPADGLVSMIEDCDIPPELDTGSDSNPVKRISIFLNVFDVHVQRVPINGTVQEVIYRPGKFLNAELDKASEHNERSTALVSLKDGRTLAVVQIAGLIARRIINTLKQDDVVNAGEKYGLIRFGSRVDVYLPAKVNPMVVVGQRVIGGETVIADLKSKEKPRSGQKV